MPGPHLFTKLITLMKVTIRSGAGDPNGVVKAPLTSMWFRDDIPELWGNVDGNTTWARIWPSASQQLEIPFAYDTASPLPLIVISPGYKIMRTEVVIDTVFDGAGAELEVGTGATPGAILSAADIDVTIADTYRTFDRFEDAAPAAVQLAITPGAGATQGSGRVFLEIWKTS